MAEQADLSKIINIIMQNPDLVSRIASLANSSAESNSTASEEETIAPKESAEHIAEASTPPERETHNRTRRKELLYAMKPYLSEQRRGAIDSMSSILDILDVMVRKES